MTPRQSARRHLPELDRSFDQLKATFGATLEHLTTPDGTWGTDPTAGWPRVHATDLADLTGWPPVSQKKINRDCFVGANNDRTPNPPRPRRPRQLPQALP